MSLLRSLLVQALATLLVVQWAGAPAHCFAMVALALDGSVICHADDGSPAHHDSDRVPVSADQSCPASHALGQAALTPEAPATPELITWSTPTPPPPRPATNARATRAPPQQPRAPPARSV
jgi:hypothetical protein